jgi:hypothetical protein
MLAVTDMVLHAPGARKPTLDAEPAVVSVSVMVASVDRRIRSGASPPELPALHTVTGNWMTLFGVAEGGAFTVCTQRSGLPSPYEWLVRSDGAESGDAQASNPAATQVTADRAVLMASM